MRRWLIFFLLPAGAAGQYAASLASNADRTALVGSYDGTGPWRVLVNGRTVRSSAADQLLLLHADGSLNDAGGRTPLVADGVGFATGRWGSACELSAKARWHLPAMGLWISAKAPLRCGSRRAPMPRTRRMRSATTSSLGIVRPTAKP